MIKLPNCSLIIQTIKNLFSNILNLCFWKFGEFGPAIKMKSNYGGFLAKCVCQMINFNKFWFNLKKFGVASFFGETLELFMADCPYSDDDRQSLNHLMFCLFSETAARNILQFATFYFAIIKTSSCSGD